MNLILLPDVSASWPVEAPPLDASLNLSQPKAAQAQQGRAEHALVRALPWNRRRYSIGACTQTGWERGRRAVGHRRVFLSWDCRCIIHFYVNDFVPKNQ